MNQLLIFVHNVFDRDSEPLQGIPMAMIDCDVHSVVPDDPRFSKRVVKIVIMKQCNPAVAEEFKRGLQKQDTQIFVMILLILQLRSQIKAISTLNKAYL